MGKRAVSPGRYWRGLLPVHPDPGMGVGVVGELETCWSNGTNLQLGDEYVLEI